MRNSSSPDQANARPRSILLTTAVLCGSLLFGCNGGQVSDRDLALIDTVELSSLVEAARSEPEAVVLIDARSPMQYERGHLPGAVSIDLAEMDGGAPNDPRLAPFETRVVYGQNPGSAIASALAKRLLAIGYEQVRLYKPGIEGWARAGLPFDLDEGPAR